MISEPKQGLEKHELISDGESIGTCFEGPRDAADKDRLARVQGQTGVQHKVRVGQLPGSDLHRLVLDGGGGHAQVELVLVLDTHLDQLLHRSLVLKENSV